MPKFKNRNEECDADLEKKFGSPDWTRSRFFRDEDTGKVVVYTPLTGGLWRVDKHEDLMRECENEKAG